MAEEIVKIITIDTRKSERSIKDLKDDIKALKKELESTAIGSKEFDLKLNQLGQLQKEYKAINEEITNSSKPVKQQMFELARFGENLAKSYSAINAAIGLMSDGNEDLQKTLAKTAYWIQLIQGLSGFAPLIKQIPSLIDKFKSWFKVLDPIEAKVNNIASDITGIDIKKLDAANGPGSNGGVIDKKDVDNIKQYNVETEKQNSFFGQNIEQRKILEARLKEQQKAYAKQKQDIKDQLTLMTETRDAYAANVKELTNYIDEIAKLRIQEKTGTKQQQLLAKMRLKTLLEEKGSYEEIARKAGEYQAMLENTESMVMELADNQRTLNIQLEATEKQLNAITGMKAKVGSFMKSVASTVGWTLIITAILTAISALWKWVTGIQTAAKKQRELNKAIDEGANSISAKSLVAFKELAKRYRELGDAADAKKQFLVDFKKEIEETGLAINNVNDADNAFVNNTPAYIQAIKDRAKAQAIENEAVRIYEEYLNEIRDIKDGSNKLNFWQNALVGMMRGEGTIIPNGFEDSLIADNIRKANEKVEKETEAMEKTLDMLFEEMFELEKKSDPYFADIEDAAADAARAAADAKAEELKTLKQYYDEALKLFMDARTRELQEVNDKYAEQIALAKKHNQDTTLLERARQREIDTIIDKYNDERLQKLKDDAEKEYQVIQQQIERIRQMNDTSNLREPQEQSFITEYKQGFGKAFMAGDTFHYQSKEDVENQYNAQVAYNNQLLELTRSRIEQENALLNQQLEIQNLSAERRLEIERTLKENEMALSDAAIKNEMDNVNAYRSLQEKKNAALQNSLSVASDIFGAMADIAGEETKAGKAFAVTQAIIDTYASANSAYSAMAGIPYVGPALGIAAAAAAIASGIANVKTILSTKVSSDLSSVSISSGSVATPPALSTPPIEYTRNLLGDKETDELNKPMKVYVLESDITEVQNKVKVVEDNASF